MSDKGLKLNERVWRLFEKAGFETKPSSQNPAEEIITISEGKERTPDLLAKTLGVKIIGWNKARKELSESFTTHLHDYETLKNIVKADSVLFVSTEKELSEGDKNYAQQHGMCVWGNEELEYYEALVETIKKFAKYEIIHSFGLKTSEETNIHNVLAIHFKQPFSQSSADLFLFTATPQLLLKTCVVLRKAQGSKNTYQRILQKSRLSKIRKFVTQSDALLPPNIIVHLNDKVRWEQLETPEQDLNKKKITLSRQDNYELVLLHIPLEYASLELIDGQHRLYGFAETEPATQEHFNLVVLGIANIPPDKRTNTLLAINDNAKRINPNLVAYLKYNDDEVACQKDNELMAIKVVIELNKISPFCKKIKLLDIGTEKITLKGFAGYDLKGLLGVRGLLCKYYSNDSKSFVTALRLYFNILKNMFQEQWNDPNKYIIFTNRGISAFLKLLKSILKTHKTKLDEEVVKKYLKPLRDKWTDENWETQKLQNKYTGTQGWKDFHRDLVKIIQEVYQEFCE